VKKKKKAFTLIELMLAALILGVLAAMAIPRLVGRTQQARIAAARADIEATIPVALGLFELGVGRLPTTEEGLLALSEYTSRLPRWKGPYPKREPRDPWGNVYLYRSPGVHTAGYDLSSVGENGVEGDADDIVNW